MPKKRKSGGRSKSGATGTVQCSKCGRSVPRDKAKKKTGYKSLVDPKLVKELREQGAQFSRTQTIKYYCVKCAVHYGMVKIRSKDDRKKGGRI